MLYKKYGKRFFDLAGALILTVVLSWVILLILFVYALLLEFPILFKQKRIGKENRPFWMWKFRTLSREEQVPLAQRNLKWGKVLRFTSLDELPQIWNIIRGEMSFIGPRPLLEEYLLFYSNAQIRRHEVKPGITGWAQVSGRNSISWDKKFELDVYYIDHISFKLDLLILLKTFGLILSFRKDVSLTEEKFKGN